MRMKSFKIFEKKTKNENFEQSHSAENSEKKDPLGFLTFVLLQNIEKNWKEDSLGTFKKFRKKSHKAEKSHSAEKCANLLLRNTCKKISTYPRVRT